VIGVGNHLSPQILIEYPSPTLHSSPCESSSLALQILCQTKETRAPIGTSKKEEFGKYFALRSLAESDSGF